MSTQGLGTGWRVSTGLLGSEPAFIGAVDGAIWVGNRGRGEETRELASFDERTGAPGPRQAIELPLDGFELVDGPLLVQRSGDTISVFDVAVGKQLFRAAFPGAKLARAHHGQLLLTRSNQDPPELLVVDGRTGAIVHTIKLGLGVALRGEVFVARRRAVLLATETVLGVDLDKGRVVSKRAIPKDLRIEGPLENQVFLASRDELLCIDIEQAKVMWAAPLGDKLVGDLLCTVRVGRERMHVLGSIERYSGPSVLITAFDRATGTRQGDTIERAGVRSLPLEAMLSPPDRPSAITGDRQVVLRRPGRAAVRLPLPPGRFPQELWTSDRVFLLGAELLAIELDSIPNARETGLCLTSVASTAATSPATVTFVGTSAFMRFRHPVYGDINVMRTPSSPPVKVGDQVLITGVTQHPGKVVKIDDWTLAGDSAAASAELVLGVDVLPPTWPTWPPQAGDESLLFGATEPAPVRTHEPLGPVVPRVEQVFGGAPIPLLRALAAKCDANSATRERWEALGATLRVTEYDPPVDVAGFDELGFVAFAAEDDRVFHGIVWSPDGQHRGVARLDAEGDHDFTWTADSFEGWIAALLRDRSQESQARLLLEELQLPASFPEQARCAEPSWFSAAVSPT